MRLIFKGFKKALVVSWGDLMDLVVFNVLYFISLLPAIAFFSATVSAMSLWTVSVTAVLLLPSCFFLFALYEIAYDVNQGKSIKFSRFFEAMRHSWRQALVWGGINVLIVLIVIGNIVFYSQFTESWAGILQFAILSAFVVWSVLQLFVLPMYPHLEEPGFKSALLNAMAVSGKYWLAMLIVAFVTAAILTLTLFFQFLAFFLTFFLIAVLSSSMLNVIFEAEFGTSEEDDAE